ncbi:hypothetical protein SAMN05421810_103161 [Amycolatopsis arida]|uniref:Uncharacterized protein n=1 Tax=Amycolatopsis arida TaxID=587909 RepID=A0A1I5SJX1_9PSEU|nr:hypothetical protein [Amycolatopsis arida]TDX96456.1 hypothetical protein CLV69_103597 [Amycolatopsis arida]SFP70951.1 hypothetical protein SAMN05421810_103161 [Amycolatopsis arida]
MATRTDTSTRNDTGEAVGLGWRWCPDCGGTGLMVAAYGERSAQDCLLCRGVGWLAGGR